MRIALHALTDELRRLKTAGVKTVAVSDETIAALRRVVASRAAASGATPRSAAVERAELPVAESATRSAAERSTARASGESTATVPVAPPEKITRPATPTPRVTAAAAAVPTLPPAPAVTLPPGDKTERWQALRERVLNDPICKSNASPGKQVVFGVGSLEAKIMFVGEAPGPDEEAQGEPFVGPAGQLLTRMIQAMGLQRAEVYLASILSWRPQMPVVDGREQEGTRPPSEDEVRYCLPYLRAQIEVVNPDLLVALGSNAAQGLLGFRSFKALGDVRGKWHEFAGKPLMVTYHPSYILRNQSNRSKRMIWDDFLKVMERAALPVTDKQRGFFLEK